MNPGSLARSGATIHPTNAGSLAEGVCPMLEFGRLFLGELGDTYQSQSESIPWWRRWTFWRRGGKPTG